RSRRSADALAVGSDAVRGEPLAEARRVLQVRLARAGLARDRLLEALADLVLDVRVLVVVRREEVELAGEPVQLVLRLAARDFPDLPELVGLGVELLGVALE